MNIIVWPSGAIVLISIMLTIWLRSRYDAYKRNKNNDAQ